MLKVLKKLKVLKMLKVVCKMEFRKKMTTKVARNPDLEKKSTTT